MEQLYNFSDLTTRLRRSDKLTIDEHSVSEGVHRPYVWCPVCMAKSS